MSTCSCYFCANLAVHSGCEEVDKSTYRYCAHAIIVDVLVRKAQTAKGVPVLNRLPCGLAISQRLDRLEAVLRTPLLPLQQHIFSQPFLLLITSTLQIIWDRWHFKGLKLHYFIR
jgi:hypothetical protein